MVYQNVLFLVVHYLNSSYLICFHFSKRVLFLSKNIQKSPVKKRRIFEINNFQLELRSRIERERRLGKFCTNNNVTTVAAFPNLNFAPFKDRSSFDIFEKSTEAFFVVLFNFSNQEEFFSKLRGTLFFGCFGEFNVHICPFVVFIICSSFQVFGSITNAKSSLYHILACSFSLSAVFKKSSAICSKPSFFALEAKKVYLLRA